MTKIYVETYGCALNQSETEHLSSALQEYQFVSRAENADILVINTCVVIKSTEKKMLRRIEALYELCQTGKELIVTGCARKLLRLLIRSGFPNAKLMTYDQVPSYITSEYTPEKCVTKTNDVKASVKIAEGCEGVCSYCIVRLIRGRLKSRSIDDILKDVESKVENGAKQIFLTGQDVGVYGLDRGLRLPELINAVTELDQNFMVRIGMINPSTLDGIVDALIDSFKKPKVYKFLHLPVQSGSDRILHLMGRNYSISYFKSVVAKFRSEFKDLTLSTDFIVGFPYETEHDFKLTLDLLKVVRPLKVNITRFSKREGTAAYHLPQTLNRTMKERSRALTWEHHKVAYFENKKWLGETFNALAVERGRGSSYVLYNDFYRPIVVEGEVKLGDRYDVTIRDITPTYLIGNLKANFN
jgi:threonylcarbamoyladenosine tRNA methylthiotransferase CDKAL1